MSFGYSIGDCIAIYQLANQLRERFADAPYQFKAISNEVTGLSNVLQDIELVLSQQVLTDWQQKALASLLEECHNVLIALGKVVDENYYLNLSNIHGFRDKSRRVWKRLTWEPDDIQELRSRVALNIGLLNAFNGSLISKVTLATNDKVEQLHKRQDARERLQEDQAILDWLTPIDYAAQQHDFISRRQAGTGQWLLDSREFRLWVDSDKQTLYCPGIPGAGKTILTAIVVEDLINRFHDNKTIGIAYLYCNFRRQDEQNIDNLLAALMKQLAEGQPSLPDSMKDLCNRHKTKRTRPSLEEISSALQSVATEYSRLFIIIDALDECQSSDWYRQRFLSEIFNLQTKVRANVFATSRSIPQIAEKLNEHLLEIRANREDIQRYLNDHISQLPAFVGRSPDLQEEIINGIVNTADGMFLLAQLHLDALKGKRSPKAIRTSLKNLATGSDAYDYAYEDAMERIGCQLTDQEQLAKQVLSWITCARRPLTIMELQHALAVEVGESKLDEENLSQIEDIVSVCAGLVTVEESNIVRLVHYTTQEYFDRTRGKWFPNIETDIAIICVAYLSFDEFESGICQTDEEFEQRLQLNKLYDYATRNWGHHARVASTLCQSVIEFLQKPAQVEASSQALIAVDHWLGHIKYRQQIPKQMTALHLAAYFGIYDAVRELLSSNNHDPEDSHGRTPLSWAVANRHEAVIKLLLEYKADIESKDRYGITPLLRATQSRHEGTVKLLLEHKADVESKDRFGKTPLWWAAKSGHESIVKLLLEHKADIESRDNWGQTPLLVATERGHEGTVKLLLEYKTDIESRDSRGQTPLLWAAGNGHEAVVKLLLAYEADIESKDGGGQTPLSCAAWNGHEAVVKLLLENGAEIGTENTSSWTALELAALNMHDGVEQLFVLHGQPEPEDIYGFRKLFS